MKTTFPKNPNGLNILIVEDDLTQITLWNYIFRLVSPGAKIRWTKTAELAEALIWKNYKRGENFNIIVSDYFLSGEMTGIDLWEKFSDFPSLFLLNSVIDKSKLLNKLQAHKEKPFFLQKPIDVDQVIDVIQTTLRKDRFYANTSFQI